MHSGVTACIAFNDLIAIGMLQRLRERGIRVPEDMSIVGCDDIFGADFCNPPLSTMASPIEQAGRVAVSMLLAQLNPLAGGGTRSRSVMPTHLTVRGSTGPARRALGRTSTRRGWAGRPSWPVRGVSARAAHRPCATDIRVARVRKRSASPAPRPHVRQRWLQQLSMVDTAD